MRGKKRPSLTNPEEGSSIRLAVLSAPTQGGHTPTHSSNISDNTASTLTQDQNLTNIRTLTQDQTLTNTITLTRDQILISIRSELARLADQQSWMAEIKISEKDINTLQHRLTIAGHQLSDDDACSLKKKLSDLNKQNGVAAMLYTIQFAANEILSEENTSDQIATHTELEHLLRYIRAIHDIAEIIILLNARKYSQFTLDNKDKGKVKLEYINEKFTALENVCREQNNQLENKFNAAKESSSLYKLKLQIKKSNAWWSTLKSIGYTFLGIACIAASIAISVYALPLLPVMTVGLYWTLFGSSFMNSVVLGVILMPKGFAKVATDRDDYREANQQLSYLQKGISFFEKYKNPTVPATSTQSANHNFRKTN